jgi:subtilase family serine protease
MISRRINTITITIAAAFWLIAYGMFDCQAQGEWHGNLYIPESTIERPQDVGVNAHTNHVLMDVPMDGLGPAQGMTPGQIRSFYGMPATGGLDVIAIVDAYDYPDALSDFNTFSAEFGLPKETSTTQTLESNKVFQVMYEGGRQPRRNVSWNLEEALDIEWAHAMAPKAKIVLVEARSSSLSDLFAAVDQAASIANVKQVSMSWGGSETPGELELDAHFNRSGPLFLAAAGDNAATTSYPAVSPYVVAVGGTTVNTNSRGAFESEIGWSDGGGGVSSFEAKPAWQAGVKNTGVKRSIPDISADGDPNTGLSVYGPIETWHGTYVGWIAVGGTSASTACMAGMLNLSEAAYSNTTLFLKHIYGLIGTSHIRDITSGNNGFPCLKGWDFVTGVGVPAGTAGL